MRCAIRSKRTLSWWTGSRCQTSCTRPGSSLSSIRRTRSTITLAAQEALQHDQGRLHDRQKEGKSDGGLCIQGKGKEVRERGPAGSPQRVSQACRQRPPYFRVNEAAKSQSV